MNNKATLPFPKTPQEKIELVNTINTQIVRLENEISQSPEDTKLVEKNQESIERLSLRRKLIGKCGELSLVRLNHLQEVFKHYCTHIHKTGKYMTFQRLQYEKVHMTMDRFFLFLKDFDLTTAQIQGKKRDVIDKPNIILLFKKMSSNARELSFEEFIQCFQRLAILYWDEKNNYVRKQKEYQVKMQNIKKMNERRRKKKMGLSSGESSPEKSEEEDKVEGSDDNNEAEEKGKVEVEEKKKAEKVEVKEEENNENDDFVNQLMNNQELEDPNLEVKEVAEKAKRENAAVQNQRQLKVEEFQILLKLTNQQQIEYYYEMLDIDSLQTYKNKLTVLNDPKQILYHHKTNSQTSGSKALSESKLQAAQIHEEERLQKLKAKMNQKKEKFKDRPLPKPKNDKARQEQQNSRRRKQMKKEREKAVKEMKVQQVKKKEEKVKNPPKIEYKEGQVTWQMLEKLTIDQLKLKQFNLSKLYTPDEDDRYFLEEFGGKPRINERLQARERQSLSIVESTKLRAQELQKKEKDRSVETQRKQPRQNTSISRNRI